MKDGVQQKPNRWGKEKPGSRPVGKKKQKERQKKKEEQLSDISSKLAAIANPFDDMNTKTKKEHAFHLFFSKLQASIKIV